MCYFKGNVKQILHVPADQPLQAFKVARVVNGTFYSPTWGTIWRGAKVTGRPTEREGGIYAFKSKTVVHRFKYGLPRNDTSGERSQNVQVVAEIELSGKVFEHSPGDDTYSGYRGSSARIVRVWMPKGFPMNSEIRNRYPWIEVVEV